MKPRYPGPLPPMSKIEMERRKALLDMYAESKNKKGKGPIAHIEPRPMPRPIPRGDMMRPVPKGPPAKRPLGIKQKPVPLRGPGKPKY
jgi:hypothetical protein